MFLSPNPFISLAIILITLFHSRLNPEKRKKRAKHISSIHKISTWHWIKMQFEILEENIVKI